jgi:hypothetical protein
MILSCNKVNPKKQDLQYLQTIFLLFWFLEKHIYKKGTFSPVCLCPYF